MTTQASLSMSKRAVRNFRHPLAERDTVRHNARSWLACIEYLGDNWRGKPGFRDPRPTAPAS